MPLPNYLPTKDDLRKVRSLRFLGDVLFQQNLWHMNRQSVSYAVLVGAICCFLPIPFQMIPAVLACIYIRCNVPITLMIVWISNPITMAPMMYFAYRVGVALLGQDDNLAGFEFSLEWLATQMSTIWQPLLLGCLVSGITVGVTGFVAVRLYYRWRIARYWQKRRRRNRLEH